jgi:photosystem II stability/assembly factor-like uncharacterized protein
VRHILGIGLAVAVGCAPTSHVKTRVSTPQDERPAAAVWEALSAEPHEGKQDDITFVDANLGFYVNGLGRIFRTADGGRSWERVRDTPGTYFRAIGMLDARTGFAGNIGTDYFPGVTDTNPLYRTRDGGTVWEPVDDPVVRAMRGVCAIDILDEPFIHAGQLSRRTVMHVAGRVGGPAQLVRSTDGGETWRSLALPPETGMVLDVKFLDSQRGIVFSSTDASVERSNALILRTEDGGASWTTAYRSTRPFELVWKGNFPTADVGFATIQSYDPASTRRYVVRTTDGGRSWTELPLADDAELRPFGIGFLDAAHGWVGTSKGGLETLDGGASWRPVELGRYANKIRVLPTSEGPLAFAIGADVYRYGPPLEVSDPSDGDERSKRPPISVERP